MDGWRPYRARELGVLPLLLWFAVAWADEGAVLRDYHSLSPDFAYHVADRGGVTLVVSGFDQRWTLELDDNPALLRSLNARDRRAVQSDGNRFLSGSIVGQPNSWARLSRVGDRWSGGFFDGEELYLIDRPGGLRLPAGRQAHPEHLVLYRFSDLELGPILLHEPLAGPEDGPDSADDSVDLSIDYLEFVSHLRTLTVLESQASLLMPITVVTDTEFNSKFGADTAAVVASRTNFIDGLYSSQLGTGIGLFHHEPLQDNGPLVATDASDLLGQFRVFMSSGAGSNIPFQGLGHLFTARDRDGSTAGIAFLGVLCRTGFGYGVDWNLNNETINGLVFAHEVGHNFNAPHDGEDACSDETFRGIMNSGINGSQQFSDCSLEQMSAAVTNASCLIENPDAQILFIDGFESEV